MHRQRKEDIKVTQKKEKTKTKKRWKESKTPEDEMEYRRAKLFVKKAVACRHLYEELMEKQNIRESKEQEQGIKMHTSIEAAEGIE